MSKLRETWFPKSRKINFNFHRRNWDAYWFDHKIIALDFKKKAEDQKSTPNHRDENNKAKFPVFSYIDGEAIVQ